MLGLLNGRLDIGVVSTGLSLPYVQEGRLKAIAVVASRRLALLPEVATLEEQGLGDVEVNVLLPLYGQADLPDMISERLNKAMAAALANPATKARLDAAYIQPMPMSPAEVGAVMRTEHERLGRELLRLGIKADSS